MNPFPLWIGITRHITQEAAEAFSAFVDSMPPLDDTTAAAFALCLLAVALPFIVGA